MHKGVILLCKAESKEDAKQQVEEFLEPYGDGDVWDWYSIGNRWSNILAPAEPLKAFTEWVHKQYPQTSSSYAIDEIENETVRPIIQAKWEELGLKGKNPYWDACGFSLTEQDGYYDIVPLESCIQKVREWIRNTDEEAEEYFNRMVQARAEEKEKNGGTMSAYYAGLYKDAKYNNFCFDSNVYDIAEGEGETIPTDISGYWAVIVDMHN